MSAIVAGTSLGWIYALPEPAVDAMRLSVVPG
jgi:hypothetical protein